MGSASGGNASSGSASGGTASGGTASGSDAAPTRGTAELELEFPPCVMIDTIDWTIHDPSVLTSDLTGSLPASQSRPIRAPIQELPAGSGYTINVTTGGSGAVCTGTATFAIKAGSTSPVPVQLVCPAVAEGGAGQGASCAVVTSVSAIPTDVDVGSSLTLTACGTNVDGSQAGVAFSWSVTGGGGTGSFDSATAPSPKFTCKTSGPVTIAVSTTAANCAASSASVSVMCTEPRASGLSLGLDHTCALLSDGTVACFGFNFAGQLGNGTAKDSLVPVAVSKLNQVTALAAGSGHTCALRSDRTVWCWGNWREVGAGSGAAPNDCSLPCAMTPIVVPGLSGVSALASGDSHMCALKSDGSVACWGTNESGELGDGTQNNAPSPVPVKGLSGAATAIAAGEAHTCALIKDGSVQCWGYDFSGQLGNGMQGPDTCSGAPCSLKPVVVSGLSGATAIAAGGSRTCAVVAGGAVRCWGFSDVGELGNGMTSSSSTPVAVSNVSGVTALFAGTYHTCARMAGGAVACWGDNAYGQFCNGTMTSASTPVTVSALSGVVTMGAGNNDTCALRSDDTIACCGWNSRGQLGDGTMMNSLTPMTISP
jgi:alpha-tubulin suppressor-like RCC1 family protein